MENLCEAQLFMQKFPAKIFVKIFASNFARDYADCCFCTRWHSILKLHSSESIKDDYFVDFCASALTLTFVEEKPPVGASLNENCFVCDESRKCLFSQIAKAVTTMKLPESALFIWSETFECFPNLQKIELTRTSWDLELTAESMESHPLENLKHLHLTGTVSQWVSEETLKSLRRVPFLTADSVEICENDKTFHTHKLFEVDESVRKNVGRSKPSAKTKKFNLNGDKPLTLQDLAEDLLTETYKDSNPNNTFLDFTFVPDPSARYFVPSFGNTTEPTPGTSSSSEPKNLSLPEIVQRNGNLYLSGNDTACFFRHQPTQLPNIFAIHVSGGTCHLCLKNLCQSFPNVREWHMKYLNEKAFNIMADIFVDIRVLTATNMTDILEFFHKATEAEVSRNTKYFAHLERLSLRETNLVDFFKVKNEKKNWPLMPVLHDLELEFLFPQKYDVESLVFSTPEVRSLRSNIRPTTNEIWVMSCGWSKLRDSNVYGIVRYNFWDHRPRRRPRPYENLMSKHPFL